MWLYLVVIVAFVGALAAGFAGIGPLALVLLAGGLVLAATRFRSGSKGAAPQQEPTGGTISSTGGRAAGGEAGPQDTADHGGKRHVETGAAHQGQRRMVPDEDQLPGA